MENCAEITVAIRDLITGSYRASSLLQCLEGESDSCLSTKILLLLETLSTSSHSTTTSLHYTGKVIIWEIFSLTIRGKVVWVGCNFFIHWIIGNKYICSFLIVKLPHFQFTLARKKVTNFKRSARHWWTGLSSQVILIIFCWEFGWKQVILDSGHWQTLRFLDFSWLTQSHWYSHGNADDRIQCAKYNVQSHGKKGLGQKRVQMASTGRLSSLYFDKKGKVPWPQIISSFNLFPIFSYILRGNGTINWTLTNETH